jgi:hypothetical protein
LGDGKVKVYASWGLFYDIMKMGLARGSFGSDYWHNCYYATGRCRLHQDHAEPGAGRRLPGYRSGAWCDGGPFHRERGLPRYQGGPARPGHLPDMKPMKQHEFVTGLEWAFHKDWKFETRYSRKRLDRTIEDMAITDNLGFYIGNPGTTFADVLHRPCPSL